MDKYIVHPLKTCCIIDSGIITLFLNSNSELRFLSSFIEQCADIFKIYALLDRDIAVKCFNNMLQVVSFI